MMLWLFFCLLAAHIILRELVVSQFYFSVDIIKCDKLWLFSAISHVCVCLYYMAYIEATTLHAPFSIIRIHL